MANEVRLPIAEQEGLLFALGDVSYSPVAPKMSEPFTIKGKVNLLKIPFFGPLWIIATVTYPSVWWEEIIPIIGSPEVRATDIAIGGNFEIAFAKGFQREGEFSLSVRVYPGPTFPIDSIVLPPAPAAATVETTFIVAGEAPPAGFRDLRILSYSKNGGTPVTPPGVLELEVGDICRVNFSLEHRGNAEAGRLYAAIGNYGAAGFDEIIANDKSFSVESSTDWETTEGYVDIPITTAISPGSGYDLYGKIVDIPGADIFSSYLEDVITITGVPVEGEFRNFGITGWTPDPAVLSIGDSLIVTHHFEYKGPRYTGADIHSAIGTRGVAGFDEILAKSVSLEAFGPNEDWVGYDVDVTIPITAAISPGVDYDLYSKLTDIPGADLYDYKNDIIEIVGAPLEPQFRNLEIIGYDSPVEAGDYCNVRVHFDYQGPVISRTLYAAIGNSGWAGFDEILHGSTTISIPKTDSWLTYEKTTKIYITSAIDPAGSPYDLYAKVDGVISPVRESVINIAGGVPSQDVKNLRIIDYDSKVDMGDYCAVTVEFEYIGKACSGTLRAALGNAGTFGFDEVKYDQDYVSIPQSMTWTRYSFNLSIPTSGMSAGYYDLYAKIGGGAPSLIGPFLYNVVEIVAAVPNPEIRNFKISSYDSQVQPGGYCQVKCSFEYQGPANSGTLRAAIGNAGTFGFDEIVYDTESISVPETPSWRAYTATARIYISTAISAGVYDLYAKITGALPNVITPTKYNVITVTKVTVSFKMSIWGIPSDFGSYDHWSCYYYDPGISGFVSDEKWYTPSSRISFSNVKSGGYIAVILAKGSVASNYYYSPTFSAVDGGIYQYDLQLNRVSKIG